MGLEILLALLLWTSSIVLGNDRLVMASLPLTDSLGVQNTSTGFLTNPISGEKYHLIKLNPHQALLSHKSFITGNSDGEVRDQRTQETIQIPVYRAVFPDGAVLLAELDTNGSFLCAELQVEGYPTIYFVRTGDHPPNELVAFLGDQVNEATLESVSFARIALPSPQLRHPIIVPRNENLVLPDFLYTPGDKSSAECVYFKVVNIGIVFDAEFCRKYGGKTEARSRVMMIVAAASLIYENEMCVRLQLVDIYTPDEDCESVSTFASMSRDNACGADIYSETFILHFRDWMNRNRDVIGLFPDAVYHAFTGFPPHDTLGCAYVGVFCTEPEFAYGVNYMISDLLSTQSVIFAHELGHNLNARHVSSADAGGSRYIMAPSVNDPNDGFSQATIEDILGWLDSEFVECNQVAFPDISSPSISPITTEMPSTEIASSVPIVSPSAEPSQAPPQAPSQEKSQEPSSCTCKLERLSEDDSSICFTESSGSLFGCLGRERLASIIRPNSCCGRAESKVYFTPLACEEIEEDDMSNDDISNDDISNDGESNRPLKQTTTAENIMTESSPHPYQQQHFSAGLDDESNDSELEIFFASDCSEVACAIFDGFVCFNAQLNAWERELAYKVTLSALFGGVLQTFTVNAIVTRNQFDGKEDETRGHCHPVETRCVDG